MLWLLAALAVWVLLATGSCGGDAMCVAFAFFLYSPFGFLIVGYIAISEWFSRSFLPKWSPLCFAGLVAVGIACLHLMLGERDPLLYAVILKPTAVVVALYLFKVIKDRWL